MSDFKFRLVSIYKGRQQRDIADERGEINRRKLGWWIRRHAGRIVEGMRFARGSGNSSAEQWMVEVVESVSPVLPVSPGGVGADVSDGAGAPDVVR